MLRIVAHCTTDVIAEACRDPPLLLRLHSAVPGEGREHRRRCLINGTHIQDIAPLAWVRRERHQAVVGREPRTVRPQPAEVKLSELLPPHVRHDALHAAPVDQVRDRSIRRLPREVARPWEPVLELRVLGLSGPRELAGLPPWRKLGNVAFQRLRPPRSEVWQCVALQNQSHLLTGVVGGLDAAQVGENAAQHAGLAAHLLGQERLVSLSHEILNGSTVITACAFDHVYARRQLREVGQPLPLCVAPHGDVIHRSPREE
mmetsp:Transcript_102420/g.298665  ORF Transcript_102420/g.298665 Transcript_102420/m.298665 type:complete len:259 (+) Transcript_102420:166-942(+)